MLYKLSEAVIYCSRKLRRYKQSLIEKFGNLSTINKLLYNELYSIKEHDRGWKTIVGSMERILRQLKAMVPKRETSALAAIKQPNPNDSKATSFCNEDQWDDECQVYQTAKQRMERLKTIEECLNCLQKGHNNKYKFFQFSPSLYSPSAFNVSLSHSCIIDKELLAILPSSSFPIAVIPPSL
uniref:ENTH domain-containing protein n=1 Tax=Loa loa TaxID=7209 RepID=A0A1I7VLL1_LOALO